MHAAISDCDKSQSGLFSRYVLSNMNGIRHHPVLKLISLVNNLTNDIGKKTEPLIMYSANNYFIYLNDWKGKHYFIGAFPMLFLFRDSKYLAKCKTIILLQV